MAQMSKAIDRGCCHLMCWVKVCLVLGRLVPPPISFYSCHGSLLRSSHFVYKKARHLSLTSLHSKERGSMSFFVGPPASLLRFVFPTLLSCDSSLLRSRSMFSFPTPYRYCDLLPVVRLLWFLDSYSLT